MLNTMGSLVTLGVAMMTFGLGFLPVAAQATFTDQTTAAGLAFTPSPHPLTPGGDFDGGGTVGDFNNDGYPDLFLLGCGGVADALFINNRDGTFTNRASEWGVAVAHRGQGATAGDYNGDGWQDLYVTSCGDMSGVPRTGQHRLYRNNGNGTFTEIAGSAGVNETSSSSLIAKGAAFGDYDLDGDLDLFVCTWSNFGEPNDGNRLFRNNDNGTFTDVTVAAGLMATDIPGFSPSFADMDGDHYPEILIAADGGLSRYFANDTDGTFTDLTAASGTGEDRNGMGSAIGDLNNDGLFEWFVTSIYFDAYPNGFGNYLYINQGANSYQAEWDGEFNDGGWGWGTVAGDFDHDGFVDLAETNGWIDAEWQNEPSYLFMNDGDMTFTEDHAAAGFTHTLQGRSLLSLDYDLDGDLDLVVVANDGAVALFRNDISGPGTHWIEVFLDTSADPDLAPNGIGTRVVATTGSVSRYAYVSGGASYLGRSQLLAHIGLGTDAVVDELRVEWSDGTTTSLSDLAADRIVSLGPPIPGAPGEASDPTAPTDPLRAAYDKPTGLIEISYAPGCNTSNHTLYYGDLGNVGSHAWSGAVCGIGSSGSASFDPGGLDDAFFVVVGNTAVVEGSYGTYGAGTERPEDVGSPGCDLPQDLTATCSP